ncbi:Leucine Rich Repeat [Seminavis robusta]|uniref:Leucine Rich Repeat n=1 Tax=Seminavis robusta TaxID=568900 RepID=A0A9N8H6U3_9STRA|nr:Leucine Rich Repeat [Seminavis robusta]|eukprot:Sro181_g079150.1 Leucine Rich Repeat (926) ;mRNA; f:71462-74239
MKKTPTDSDSGNGSSRQASSSVQQPPTKEIPSPRSQHSEVSSSDGVDEKSKTLDSTGNSASTNKNDDEWMDVIKEQEKAMRLHPAVSQALDGASSGEPSTSATARLPNRTKSSQGRSQDFKGSPNKATASQNDRDISRKRAASPTRKQKTEIKNTPQSSSPGDTQQSNRTGDDWMKEIKEHEKIARENPAIALALNNTSNAHFPPPAAAIAGNQHTPQISNAADNTDFRSGSPAPGQTNKNARNDSPPRKPPPRVQQPRTTTPEKMERGETLFRQSSDDLMKAIAIRSIEDGMALDATATTTVTMDNTTHTNNSTADDSTNYSQQAKKRISGHVQPGAFGAAPGMRPTRQASLHYATLLNSSLSESNYFSQELNDTQHSSNGSNKNPNSERPPVISTRNIGLVEAHPVSSYFPFPRAQAYEEPSEDIVARTSRQERCRLAQYYAVMVLGFTTFVLLILYATGAIFSSDSSTEPLPSSASPSLAPTMAVTEYEYSLELPSYTQEAIEADPTSAQARAYQWIKQDVLLETYSPYRQLQRFALATLYYATNGHTWEINEMWLSYADHECLWQTKGVFLLDDGMTKHCDPDGNFLDLYLTKNGLSGSLPPELGLLTKLEVLDVATNNIRGTIPSQIGLMTSLYELILDANELTAAVPSEIYQLTRLECFYVHTNPVTGTIMTEVGLLTNMIDFEWTDTLTRGTIPTELGLMTQTTALFLWANLLEGAIPSEIGSMTNMTYGFGLYGQSLTGTIPTEIGRMTDLESLYLDANFLTGQIPSELGRFHKITEMYLKANDLRGAIPSTFGLLTSLVVLDLSSTSISGSIPSELGALTAVSWINLDATNLADDVPAELGNLGVNGECEKLKLNDTLVTGEIPSGLCDISDLSFDCSDDLCGCDCVCHFGAQGSVDASARGRAWAAVGQGREFAP